MHARPIRLRNLSQDTTHIYIRQFFIHYILIAPDKIMNGTGQSIIREDQLLT
jgi:hypothetical protein